MTSPGRTACRQCSSVSLFRRLSSDFLWYTSSAAPRQVSRALLLPYLCHMGEKRGRARICPAADRPHLKCGQCAKASNVQTFGILRNAPPPKDDKLAGFKRCRGFVTAAGQTDIEPPPIFSNRRQAIDSQYRFRRIALLGRPLKPRTGRKRPVERAVGAADSLWENDALSFSATGHLTVSPK